jgi:predicted aminopeptidase
MSLETRINKLESLCEISNRSVEHERAAQINFCTMLLRSKSAVEQQIAKWPKDDPAERATIREECDELRQKVVDLQAGKYDAEIAAELHQPTETNDERAKRSLDMLRKGRDEHKRKKEIWRAYFEQKGNKERTYV